MESLTIDPSNYWRRRYNPVREVILGLIRCFISFFSATEPNLTGILGDLVDFAKEVVDLAEKISLHSVGQQLVLGAETTPETHSTTAASDLTGSTPARRQQACRMHNHPVPVSKRNCSRRFTKTRRMIGSRHTPSASPQSRSQATPSSTHIAGSTEQGISVKARTGKQIPKRSLTQAVVDLETSSVSSITAKVDFDCDTSTSPEFSPPTLSSDRDSDDSGDFLPEVDFENEPTGSNSYMNPKTYLLNLNTRRQQKLQTAVGSDCSEDETLRRTNCCLYNSDTDSYASPSSPSPPKAPKISKYSPYTPVSENESE